MSAERGWIGDPQPPKEWHIPGWVKTGGRHFVHCSRQADREASKGQYHILPDDPLRALDILREAAGLEPLPEPDDDDE